MKKVLLMTAALTMLMQAPVLYADEKHHSKEQGQSKIMQKGTEGGMRDMGMMKQSMQKMMKQMEEIHATKDPKKRKQLMREHMQNMHEGMKMMRGMGGGMMNGRKGGGGMMGKGMDSKDMAQRHQMMEQRMDMMQMMMEQMMEQMMAQKGMSPKMKK